MTPPLVARALTACGVRRATTASGRGAYFAEAARIARDTRRSHGGWGRSSPRKALRGPRLRRTRRGASRRRGRTSDRRGHRRRFRRPPVPRYVLGWAQVLQRRPRRCVARLRRAVAEECTADPRCDVLVYASVCRRARWPTTGARGRARTAAEQPRDARPDFFEYHQGAVRRGLRATCTWPRAMHGGVGGIRSRRASSPACIPRRRRSTSGRPLAPLACGDLAAARRWADDVVSATTAGSGGRVDVARARRDRTGRTRRCRTRCLRRARLGGPPRR